MNNYTSDELPKLIDLFDHRIIATKEELTRICMEARDYNFHSVAVNSVQVEHCSKFLAGTDVSVCAAIGFPLGQSSVSVKAFECEDAISNGAKEIEYVVNLTELKAGNLKYLQTEMQVITDICRTKDVICKAVFQTCDLFPGETEELTKVALEVKPDFIKTSTGFGYNKSNPDEVKLLKSLVGDSIKIEASDVDDLKTMYKMLEAGADRISTSKGAKIIDDAKESK